MKAVRKSVKLAHPEKRSVFGLGIVAIMHESRCANSGDIWLLAKMKLLMIAARLAFPMLLHPKSSEIPIIIFPFDGLRRPQVFMFCTREAML